jgi:hypothetical protein
MVTRPAPPDLTADPDAGVRTLPATVRLKDLVDSVAEASGGKKAEVRATVEATLEVLGRALAEGRPFNLPGLGKLRVAKDNGTVLTLKLRLADGPRAAGLALAKDDEDG